MQLIPAGLDSEHVSRWDDDEEAKRISFDRHDLVSSGVIGTGSTRDIREAGTDSIDFGSYTKVLRYILDNSVIIHTRQRFTAQDNIIIIC